MYLTTDQGLGIKCHINARDHLCDRVFFFFFFFFSFFFFFFQSRGCKREKHFFLHFFCQKKNIGDKKRGAAFNGLHRPSTVPHHDARPDHECYRSGLGAVRATRGGEAGGRTRRARRTPRFRRTRRALRSLLASRASRAFRPRRTTLVRRLA